MDDCGHRNAGAVVRPGNEPLAAVLEAVEAETGSRVVACEDVAAGSPDRRHVRRLAYLAMTEATGTVTAWIAHYRYPSGASTARAEIHLIPETSMPFAFGCPARILDALSPTSDPNAFMWRQICRSVVDERETGAVASKDVVVEFPMLRRLTKP